MDAVGHEGESRSCENIVFPLCCHFLPFFHLSLWIYSVVPLVAKCFGNSLMLSMENIWARSDKVQEYVFKAGDSFCPRQVFAIGLWKW